MAARTPSVLPPPTPLARGTRVGRYEVRSVLGSGTFGLVYRCADPQTGGEFAVKEFLPPTLAHRTQAMEVEPRSREQADEFALGLRMFLDEGRVLPRFDHPSLVKVHDSWSANGTGYLAMDLITGRNLVQVRQLRRRGPREETLRAMMDSVLDALETLHRAKLQHRDVAPQSLMMQADGRLVLLELGSARRVASARGDTGPTGPRAGYAPAELYGRDPALPRGPWTDLYALAATMHFMITGKPPPPAPQRRSGDRVALQLAHRSRRYSPEFVGALDWMLAPAPSDRPQSVAQLRAVLAGKRPLPPAHVPPRHVRLAAALHRRRLWLTGGVVLLMLAAAATLVVHRVGLASLTSLLSR